MKKKNTDEAVDTSSTAPTPTPPELAASAPEPQAASTPVDSSPESSPESAPAAPEPVVSAPDVVERQEVNRLVAEAEARGYLRGRNELAEVSMNTPGLWENPRRTAMDRETDPDPAYGFLSKIRPGVWD